MEEMDREAKWNKAMHKFIGCEPSSKVYVIWIIFLLRTVFVPLSIIMGAVALTDENIKTSLPAAIINAGVLEICWAPAFFCIYLFIPYKAAHGKDIGRSTMIKYILNMFLALLSFCLVVMMVVITVLLVQVPSSVVGRVCEDDPDCIHCPKVLFYGSWVWCAFKYLDIIKLGCVLPPVWLK